MRNVYEDDVKYAIDSSIESILLHIYNQADIETGDITPEQWDKLNRLEDELTKLMLELIRQNKTESVFFDIEAGEYISLSRLKKQYDENREEHAIQGHDTFTHYLKACTDRTGMLEEV
jgi:hypothetical protein